MQHVIKLLGNARSTQKPGQVNQLRLMMCLTSNALQGHPTPRIKRDGDFKDLVTQSTVFADKSLLIKDIVEDENTTILITMPRRWGKTVNLNMLKRFLEIPVDDNGAAIDKTDKESTDNYQIFHADCVLQPDGYKSKLAISRSKMTLKKSQDIFDREEVDALSVQGTYPVIYIDFKNCKGSDYDSVNESVKAELNRCFRMHGYLRESKEIEEEDRALAKKYTGVLSSQTLSEIEVKDGLLFLSRILHKHHHQKVWMLVDEYDAVADVAYREFSQEDLARTIKLFAGIYEKALKGNTENLEKGVLTGVQYIAQSGMLSGLNNPGKYDFTSAKYAQHYGLDQSEVDLFFAHFEVPPLWADRAKKWYNGYKVRKYLPHRATAQSPEMVAKYNVWSIVSYLIESRDNGDFAKFKSYWEQSGNIDFMRPLFKQTLVRDAIEGLVNGDHILLHRRADFSVEDFTQLKDIGGGNKEITQDGLTVLLSYLCTGGYLTLSEEGDNYYRLPNKEITYEMGRRLITYYQTLYTIDPEKMQQATDILQRTLEVNQTADVDAPLSDFYHSFRRVIRSIQLVGDRNTEGIFTNEAMIHAILNYIGVQTRHTTMGSEIYTEKLSSENQGRLDLKMTKGNVGMIIEVKCVTSPKKSNAHMEEALRQAKSNRKALTTAHNIFLAINVEKEAPMSEQRNIELLCTAELFGEERTIGIDAEGKMDSNSIKRRKIG